MISQEDVIKVARLARLGITQEEAKKLQEDLLSILSYFEKLTEVDVSKISVTAHSSKMRNVMRNDNAKITENRDLFLKQVPKMHKGYLKVKSILQ